MTTIVIRSMILFLINVYRLAIQKKSVIESGVGKKQFIQIEFEEIVHVSSIKACAQFWNSKTCDTFNRFEYLDTKTKPFLTKKTFDHGNVKCCYRGNNHLWLHNVNIQTRKLRFITDDGSVKLSFLRID